MPVAVPGNEPVLPQIRVDAISAVTAAASLTAAARATLTTPFIRRVGSVRRCGRRTGTHAGGSALVQVDQKTGKLYPFFSDQFRFAGLGPRFRCWGRVEDVGGFQELEYRADNVWRQRQGWHVFL